MTISIGETIPEGTFQYIPYTDALADHGACGIPVALSTNEWKGKKVVLVSVPGAFTPTCHLDHLPPFLEKYQEFKAKGVDVIAVLAANDSFVMSAWGRVSGLTNQILALSDADAKWSQLIGLGKDLSSIGFGMRTERYALIIDDLVVKYVGVGLEGATTSAANCVLAHL